MSEMREFLRGCLRAPHDAAARAAVRAAIAAPGLDWQEAVQVATAMRVAPLAYRALRREPGVPSEALASLRRAYLQSARDNLVLRAALELALDALERAGVETIVLKGAALTATIYDNEAVRPMADADLLVRRRDLDTARAVLGTLGFALTRVETRDGALAAFENEILLVKPGPVPVAIEIHWNLFDSPYYQQRLDVETCFATAVPLQLGAATTRMLDRELQLLHLCGHLVLHHGGQDLLWEHDIAELVRRQGTQIDWARLLGQARDWHLVIALQRLLLPLAAAGAPIPADAVTALRGLEVEAEERRAVAALDGGPRGVGDRFWTDLTSLRGWRPRLAYAWTHLFPSATYMRERYAIRHRALLPLYYPYRWMRGLRNER